MKTIQVGVIGTGYIGMVHLEMLRRLGGVEIVAVADPNAGLARGAAAKFGIERVYESAASLVDDPAEAPQHLQMDHADITRPDDPDLDRLHGDLRSASA